MIVFSIGIMLFLIVCPWKHKGCNLKVANQYPKFLLITLKKSSRKDIKKRDKLRNKTAFPPCFFKEITEEFQAHLTLSDQ